MASISSSVAGSFVSELNQGSAAFNFTKRYMSPDR